MKRSLRCVTIFCMALPLLLGGCVDSARNTVSDAASGVGSVVSDVGEGAGNLVSRAGEGVSQGVSNAQSAMDDARNDADNAMNGDGAVDQGNDGMIDSEDGEASRR